MNKFIKNLSAYFDYNATSPMLPAATASYVSWINAGNPSANYATAAQQMLAKSSAFVGGENFTTIFNSGASESNATVIRALIDYYFANFKIAPHIIVCAPEHKSILALLESIPPQLLQYSIVKCDIYGRAICSEIRGAARTNTIMMVCMGANNETGVINDAPIIELAKWAKDNSIIIYSDCAQSFKFGLNPYVDVFGVSFHKCHGPPGVGAIGIRNSLLKIFTATPMISGAQMGGARGGTENIPGIAAAITALEICREQRNEKNKRLGQIKKHIIGQIAAHFKTILYEDYVAGYSSRDPCIVIFSASKNKQIQFLPSTILLSIVKFTPPAICNINIKSCLAKAGVIVSIGSACNTSSAFSSHVLDAIGADSFVKKGALRISFGDLTTKKEIAVFLAEFIKCVKALNCF